MQPLHRVGFGDVGFGMHHRQAVAVEVLLRNHVVAIHFARGPRAAVDAHEVFVSGVVIVAHDALRPNLVMLNPIVLLGGEAVIEQVAVHGRAGGVAVGEVEREKAFFVLKLGQRNAVGVFGMEILRRFTLDKHGMGRALGDGPHSQHVGFAERVQRPHKAPVVGQPFVPPAVLG